MHFAPRVINGHVCPKGHCPWQALLTEGGEFSCGAVVLSPRWLLTAAHCVWGRPAAVFNVTVGEHDLTVEERTEQRRSVLKVLVHPGYNKSSYDNDVALLRLQRPVKLGVYVVPICLPARNSTFIRTLGSVRESTVSGWGRLAQFGATAQVLQRAVLPRVSQQDCRLHSRLNITKNMFCAGLRAGGRDACKGDSGGPLVTYYRKTWFLTGVVSWGKDCAKENLYGVYAKVSRFVDWIQDAMSSY
ncbi:coagulation factor VII [Etheostoma cragini]|uniref:coagulation factor VII n=1 Tax=Etheostoma cragini TaxID=417921 RepID=UPI00155EEC48|nr:coagulation factor VII [Etheostoma cragini]